MTPSDLLVACLLAILFGMVGQGARAIVGLKKRGERNAAKNVSDTAAAVSAEVAASPNPGLRAAALTTGAAPPLPAAPSAEADPFDGKSFAASFALGAVAGVAAYLGLYFNDAKVSITAGSTIMGIVAAGYTGSDFIEGFVKKQAIR